jgi:hypothetical protein
MSERSVNELSLQIRIRRGLLADLLEMRSRTRRPNYTIENYVAELLEATIATYRLGKISGDGPQASVSAAPLPSRPRRGLRPDVVRKIENLRFLLPATVIARRFRISRSTVLRIVNAARAREHNRQGDFPQMKGY